MLRSAVLSGVLLALAAVVPITARAAIFAVDDPSLGAGKVTRDTDTSLEWLDLDLTSNLTWNGAEAAYSDFGFRHATPLEVEQFFGNAGLRSIGFGAISANYAPAQGLVSLIGCRPGFDPTTNTSTCNAFAWTAISGGFSELAWLILNHKTERATATVNSNNLIGPSAEVFDTFAHPARSHWMVRSVVPVPATVWLFATALAGFGLYQSRSSRRSG